VFDVTEHRRLTVIRQLSQPPVETRCFINGDSLRISVKISISNITAEQNTQSARQMAVLRNTTVGYESRKLHLQIP